jgi:hypothetical protein
MMNNLVLITALALILTACGGADIAGGMASNGGDLSGGNPPPVADFAAYVATFIDGAPQSVDPAMMK